MSDVVPCIKDGPLGCMDPKPEPEKDEAKSGEPTPFVRIPDGQFCVRMEIDCSEPEVIELPPSPSTEPTRRRWKIVRMSFAEWWTNLGVVEEGVEKVWPLRLASAFIGLFTPDAAEASESGESESISNDRKHFYFNWGSAFRDWSSTVVDSMIGFFKAWLGTQ